MAEDQIKPVIDNNNNNNADDNNNNNNNNKNNNNNNNNTSISQSQASTSQKSKKFVLKIELLGDSEPLRVKVKPSTKWSKIFKSFCDYKGRTLNSLRFLFDGEQIKSDETVGNVLDDLDEDEMNNEIQIGVMYEQQGGGNRY